MALLTEAVNGLGNVEVVLLLRSRIFRGARASTTKGPNPLKVFHALLPLLLESLGTRLWRLPSLPECQLALKADKSA